MHRNKDGGTLVLDKRIPHLGRLKRATGTNDPETFRRIEAMVADCVRRKRWGVLEALQDGRLGLIELVVPGPLRSFAPQRKVSWVYVIHRPATNEVKIGVSRCPRDRMATLQTGSSSPLVLLAKVRGAHSEEQMLHERFAAHRKSGEWFEASPEILEWAKNPRNPMEERLASVLPTASGLLYWGSPK